MLLVSGSRLGPYEVLAPVGAGGMGEVYQARDTRLDRMVAIKVLAARLAGREDLRKRFEREARLISSLNHPHICILYDVGHQDGTDYLVMEYVEGATLAQRLQSGPLLLKETLEICRQIAEALEAAHEKGIIHRDLKPGNVKITPEGKAKVLDFGLAKASANWLGSAETESPTVTAEDTRLGVVMGTAPYMSPEQARGAGGGQTHRCVGVRMFALRGRHRPPGFSRSDRLGLLGRYFVARSRVGGAARIGPA